MKYYKDKNNNIYTGDRIFPDIELTEEELNDYNQAKEQLSKISKVKEQLLDIDLKRIRSLAEINNPDIIDKSFSVNKLKELEIEAQILRSQLT